MSKNREEALKLLQQLHETALNNKYIDDDPKDEIIIKQEKQKDDNIVLQCLNNLRKECKIKQPIVKDRSDTFKKRALKRTIRFKIRMIKNNLKTLQKQNDVFKSKFIRNIKKYFKNFIKNNLLYTIKKQNKLRKLLINKLIYIYNKINRNIIIKEQVLNRKYEFILRKLQKQQQKTFVTTNKRSRITITHKKQEVDKTREQELIMKYGKELIDKLKKKLCGMKTRCYNINHKDYKYYGAKGIKIYQQWLDNKLDFLQWALENGFSKETLVIDRIDSNKGYEPSNCRFVTVDDNNCYLKGHYTQTHEVKPSTLYYQLGREVKYYTLKKWLYGYKNKSNYYRPKTMDEIFSYVASGKYKENCEKYKK